MDPQLQHALLRDPQSLIRCAADRLWPTSNSAGQGTESLKSSASVLLLLCEHGTPGRLCLVLNKRSNAVRQPGDLCLPGGGISWTLDSVLSQLLRIPGSPLRRWPAYERWRREGNPLVPLLLTTALREGFEEMRLDPTNLRLLGLLPSQGLRVLGGAIHPIVAWLRRPQTFRPNWEVERVVLLPLEELLDPARHGRLRVRYESGDPPLQDRLREEFGCFEVGGELLWGLTYRIVELFLAIVVEVELPALAGRRLHERTLANDYFTRRRQR